MSNFVVVTIFILVLPLPPAHHHTKYKVVYVSVHLIGPSRPNVLPIWIKSMLTFNRVKLKLLCPQWLPRRLQAHLSKKARTSGGEGSGEELGMIWAREIWAHKNKGACMPRGGGGGKKDNHG
jgi:hypothetical protein